MSDLNRDLEEIRWRFEREKFATTANPYTFDRLLRCAARNPAVHVMLTAWRKGQFASLESALIATVIELASQNEKLLETAVVNLQNQAGPMYLRGGEFAAGGAAAPESQRPAT